MSFYNGKNVLIGVLSTVLLAGTASATCDLGQTCRLANPDPNVKIIPFSAPASMSISDISSRTIPGLGPNERLCPVKCPVGVDVPNGGEVLGCYDICKPIAPTQHTQRIARTQTVSHAVSNAQSYRQANARTEHIVKYEPYVVNPVVQTTHVRVIRPVVYVRYPVPVPVTPCGQIIHSPMPHC